MAEHAETPRALGQGIAVSPSAAGWMWPADQALRESGGYVPLPFAFHHREELVGSEPWVFPDPVLLGQTFARASAAKPPPGRGTRLSGGRAWDFGRVTRVKNYMVT